MNKDYRWAVLALGSLALWFFWRELNHFLVPMHLSIYLGGLLITYGILRLSFYTGLIHTLLVAAWLDATAPTYPFGTGILVFSLLHLGLFTLRGNFPRQSNGWMLITALVANLFLFLFWSLYHLPQQIELRSYFWRIFYDLILSQGLLTIIAIWYFSLQNALLNLCHMPLDEESPLSP